jgi:hypothetical protein
MAKAYPLNIKLKRKLPISRNSKKEGPPSFISHIIEKLAYPNKRNDINMAKTVNLNIIFLF